MKGRAGWLAPLLAGLGVAGACTVADKGDYTFRDGPGDTAGEGGMGSGGTSGNGGTSGSNGSGGSSSGTTGASGEGGDDSGGAAGTGTAGEGGTSSGGSSGTSGSAGEGGGGGDDPCDPNPCVHGTCTAAGDDFACSCEDGWDGPTCEENIDDCTPNPCANNGTCVDLVADFECSCPDALTGKTCELPRFELLGANPERTGYSIARAVNALGTVVVGWYQGPLGDRPFRWTRETGIIAVPVPPGTSDRVRVHAVTNNGNGWVGEFSPAATMAPFPFRGTEASAMALALPSGALAGSAMGVSGGGDRAVGYFTDNAASQLHAVYWSEDVAGAQPLTNPFSSNYAIATAITRDGSVIAGVVRDSAAAAYLVLWPDPTNPTTPRRIANATEAEVTGMSAAGMSGVGTYFDMAFRNFAFLYDANGVHTLTADNGMPFPHSRAWDVSDDGVVIVGEARADSASAIQAMICLDARTPRTLVNVLNDARVSVPTGWSLVRAYGVSANGKVVVGEAVSDMGETNGFIARLP